VPASAYSDLKLMSLGKTKRDHDIINSKATRDDSWTTVD
jgi:hypothetical protein